MVITSSTWSSTAPCAAGRLLVQLPLPVLEALTVRDLETANKLFGKYELPPLPQGAMKKNLGEKSYWDKRMEHLREHEEDLVWVSRLVVGLVSFLFTVSLSNRCPRNVSIGDNKIEADKLGR